MTQPEKKFKAGAITATVWKNEVQNAQNGQGHYFSVSLDRVYRDKDGNWKRTNSMRANDLPKAVLVLNKAFEYLSLDSPDASVVSAPKKEDPVATAPAVDIETIM